MDAPLWKWHFPVFQRGKEEALWMLPRFSSLMPTAMDWVPCCHIRSNGIKVYKGTILLPRKLNVAPYQQIMASVDGRNYTGLDKARVSSLPSNAPKKDWVDSGDHFGEDSIRSPSLSLGSLWAICHCATNGTCKSERCSWGLLYVAWNTMPIGHCGNVSGSKG